MSEEVKETAQATEETAAAPDVTQEKAATQALADALQENDRLKKELDAEKDRYLRMLAEYENYRKRTQKEREGVYTDAVADTVAAFLPVLDNLERAGAVAGDPAKIAEGLDLTAKQARAVLTSLHVEETATAGDAFDPMIHNAVMHVEDDTCGESEIVEVLQRGYRREGKVIRHAMVKVAN